MPVESYLIAKHILNSGSLPAISAFRLRKAIPPAIGFQLNLFSYSDFIGSKFLLENIF